MNIEFNESRNFNTITSILCDLEKGDVFRIKKELGEGTIELKQIREGVSLAIFDFNLKQPVIAKWNFESEEKNEYFFINNLSDKIIKKQNSNFETIEEGALIFTQNNLRRRLWIPKIQYTAIAVIFSDEWLQKMNLVFPFPENISSFIANAKSIYFNSDITVNSRLVLKQILDLKDKSKENISLLELKILELVFSFVDKVFSQISTQKTNLSIHPDDFITINNFVDTFNSRINNLPTLKEAANATVMSESKFQRLFKKIFRKTYYAYVLELRMNYALELLMSKMSVSQVAHETGYSSISNFTIAFKRHFKYLPSEVLF
jgi:AraC-like DNA-binding protein